MKKKVVALRVSLERQIKSNMGLELMLDQKNIEQEHMMSTQVTSDQLRKLSQDKLREFELNCETIGNNLYNLKMEQKIANHSIQFLQENFTVLHKAIENIQFDKQLGD